MSGQHVKCPAEMMSERALKRLLLICVVIMGLAMVASAGDPWRWGWIERFERVAPWRETIAVGLAALAVIWSVQKWRKR